MLTLRFARYVRAVPCGVEVGIVWCDDDGRPIKGTTEPGVTPSMVRAKFDRKQLGGDFTLEELAEKCLTERRITC